MIAARLAVVALAGWLCIGGCGLVDDEVRPPASTTPASTSAEPVATTDLPPVTPPTTGAPSVFEPEPVRWGACTGGDGSVECAILTVPLDHADPAGETIELALARRPADDAEQRLGVLAVNPGGPGGSGVDLLVNGFGLGGEIDERFDLVSWDPRGVGASTAITCGGDALDAWLSADPSPDDPQELGALEDAADALAAGCDEADGDLLAHVSTEATVEDLDLIRAALGEDQLSYLGLSYGTLIGLLYLEAHPDRVRTMALDGVMDPAAALPEHARAQAEGFESALAEMADWCATGRCAVPDVLAAYDEVAARVERSPIPAGPYPPVGPAELTIAAAAALYDSGSWDDLAAGLAEALSGDASLLASYRDAYFAGASFTAYTAVICSDLGAPDRAGFDRLADDLGADLPRFGPSLAYELLPCAYWPTPPVRTPRAVHVSPETRPILLVGGTGDPATPLRHAEAAAEQVPSQLLVVDMDSHVALGSNECATGWISAHLLDGSLPPPGARC